MATDAVQLKYPGLLGEIVESIGEAALGSVPLVGAALAVSLVAVLNWRLNDRREK